MVNLDTKQPYLPAGVSYMRQGDSEIRPIGTLLMQNNVIYRVTRYTLVLGTKREVIEPLGRSTNGRVDWFPVPKE